MRIGPLLALAIVVLAAAGSGAAPSGDGTILRDRWGVPLISESGRGASDRSVYANGYAQAEDRLFEMDLLRRAGSGRLAEMLGPGYLLMDEVVRRDGYTAAERRRLFERLAARDRRSLEADRDRGDAVIAEGTADPRRLPVEFGGVPPAPRAVEDSGAAGVPAGLGWGGARGDE